MSKLVVRSFGDIELAINDEAQVKIVRDTDIIDTFIVEEGNVLSTVLDKLIDNKIDITADNLSEFCDSCEEMFLHNVINNYPKIRIGNGTLVYTNGDIIFKKDNDTHYGRLITAINPDKDGSFSATFAQLSIMKEGIKITSEQYKGFVEEIKQFAKKESESGKIVVTSENYRELASKVPEKVMLRFLKEYFNRR